MSDVIDRILAARDTATRSGDTGMVNECTFELNRLGYRPGQPEAAREQAAARADAEAQPAGSGGMVKRHPGRPRKDRI